MVIRNHKELTGEFFKAGWVLLKEYSYPQWGIKALEKIDYLKSKLFIQNGKDFETSAPRYDILKRIILTLAYVIDYYLSIPYPFGNCKTKILLFKKSRSS